MKTALLLCLITSSALAQGLSAEEQKNLIEENRMLREEIKKLQDSQNNPTSAQSQKMMEALQRGKRFQEEQNKALEELDKED